MKTRIFLALVLCLGLCPASVRFSADAAGEFRHSVRSIVSQRCLTGAARSSDALAP